MWRKGDNMKKDELKKKRIIWVIWLAVLIISAYFVPFVLLRGINQVEASFLYWTVFAIAAILSTIKITTYWSD
jgi:hypothetical protein